MFKYHTRRRVARLGLLLASVYLLLLGASKFLHGEPDYSNYWGGSVLSIVPIIIGLFAGYAATIGFTRLSEKVRSGRRLPWKARRKSSHEKSPFDDYNKPWTGGS